MKEPMKKISISVSHKQNNGLNKLKETQFADTTKTEMFQVLLQKGLEELKQEEETVFPPEKEE